MAAFCQYTPGSVLHAKNFGLRSVVVLCMMAVRLSGRIPESREARLNQLTTEGEFNAKVCIRVCVGDRVPQPVNKPQHVRKNRNSDNSGRYHGSRGLDRFAGGWQYRVGQQSACEFLRL